MINYKNATIIFKSSIFFTFLFTLLTPQHLQAANDTVVATVNGTKIYHEDFLRNYRQQQIILASKQVSKSKVLNDMINRIIGIERAKKLKIQEDPAVVEKVNDIYYHAQISKDLEPQLQKIVKPSDADVKKYYDANKEYHTAHILLRIPVNAPKEIVQATFDKSLEIYNRVAKNPDTFSKEAKRYSQTAVAENGGDIGFQPAFRLDNNYFLSIKNKKKGFITRPVLTQFGYHIIKVLGVRPYDKIEKELYKKHLYDIKRDKILESYFTSLRKDAKIKINESVLGS